jgi:DNA-binding MarR family transcriptional regulator
MPDQPRQQLQSRPAGSRVTDPGVTTKQLRDSLRQLRVELAVHTRRVATATGLNESDLDVLDLLARDGAQSPTVLARRLSVHPATMTGVLGRLERGGWIVRRRDVTDRRSVQVEPASFERLTAIYRNSNRNLNAIAARLDPAALRAILDYLDAVSAVVRNSAERLRPPN